MDLPRTHDARAMMYRRHLRETPGVALRFRLAQARERLALALKGRPDLASTLVVAGSGRGGTTWLAQMIATAPGMQLIFEPLHPVQGPAAKDLDRDVLESVYLRPDRRHPRWKQFFAEALVGRVRNWWTDQERQHLFPWRYLVKMIRANLMLGWLSRRFGCPILLILRHPCAVVRSRLARGWTAPVERLLDQPALMEDHLAPWEGLIRTVGSELERHAILWAVETRVSLRQMRGRAGALLFYERLCAQPLPQVRALCTRLGLPFTSSMARAIRRLSVAQDRDGQALPKEHFLGRWQRDLSPAQQAKILDIARAFGLTFYDRGRYPRLDNAIKTAPQLFLSENARISGLDEAT